MSLYWRTIAAWQLLLTPAVLAQTTVVSAPSSSFLFSSSSHLPGAEATDNASNSNNDDDMESGGLNTYYSVGLALLLVCVALALFFMFRRKAREMSARRRGEYPAPSSVSRPHGWINPHDPRALPVRGQRRGWPGPWRDPESGREEGLNEQGEAPPQYIPKSEWEAQQHSADGQPGIPMHTLSRNEAGLKPPEYYSEASATDPNAQGSAGSASSSRPNGPPVYS